MPLIFLAAPLDAPDLTAALGLPQADVAAQLPGSRAADGGTAGLPCRVASAGTLAGGVCDVEAAAVETLRMVATVIGWDVLVAPGRLLADGEAPEAAMAVVPGAAADGPAWDAGVFTGRWQPLWREALAEIVACHGPLTEEDIAARLPNILSRAHSTAMARRDARPFRGRLDASDVTVHDRRRPYSAFFALDEIDLSHTRHDGSQSAPMRRAAFIAADAVTVLPYDPRRDRVMLVEQFRAGPFARGDRRPWILEPVAGRIEPGDTPDETARKETREEAGLELSALHPVAEYYPSTGCFTEYVHSYVGIADLPDDAVGVHGVPEEHEDIRSHLLSREEFFERILAGEMPDAPLILTAYWLMHNVDRLRGVG